MKTIKQLSVLTSRVIKQNLTDTDTIITTFIMPIEVRPKSETLLGLLLCLNLIKNKK